MSRRVRRKFPNNSGTSRRTPQRKPNGYIFIFCEGKNTEPDYLEKFATQHTNGLVDVECLGKCGVPVTVVDKAIAKQKCHRRENKHVSGVEDDLFVAMVDRDEHPHIPTAKDKARQANILFIMSNPCIEIWALWHIQEQSGEIHRHDLQHLLKEQMPGYDHQNKAYFNYNLMADNDKYETAKKRAISLEKRHYTADTKFLDQNPSSNIYKVLDKIIKGGKN